MKIKTKKGDIELEQIVIFVLLLLAFVAILIAIGAIRTKMGEGVASIFQ